MVEGGARSRYEDLCVLPCCGLMITEKTGNEPTQPEHDDPTRTRTGLAFGYAGCMAQGDATMTREADCIFCKIVAGEIPCFKLHEDDATLAFMDINPANPGHALVVPKDHAVTIHDIDADALAAVARAAKRVAAAVEAELSPPGLSLYQANGPAAAQSVPHLHIHVLPRRDGDDLPMNWPLRPGDMDAIGALAEKIRARIARA